MLQLWLAAALVALPPLMPLDKVERGQKGECVTVFEGNAIEPFPFEVKGLMKNFLGPGKDVVLVRLLGEKATFTGVVAGMSGSPCTIGGKLLGALSYSFATFAKEPIAGITPMATMLEVMHLPKEERPWRVGSGTDDWRAMRDGRAAKDVATGDGLRPIAAPLSMAGVSPRVRDHFAPALRELGFEPVAGGSAGTRGKGLALQPGSAVAAVLVSGDVDISATGTVTSVEGDEVLAFGHPFFGLGAISVPMAQAEILNTMVSDMRSFKMSALGPIVGEFTEDRLTAIAGRLGAAPPTVPIRGRVTTSGGRSEFAIQVARDVMLTPRFVAIGLASALAGRIDIAERGTLRVDATITPEGLAPLHVRNVYSAERDGNLPVYAAIEVAQALATLWSTPFGPPPRVTIDLQTTFDPAPREEWVEALLVSRPLVRAGEAVELTVRLREVDGPVREERLTLHAPSSWAGQRITLMAAGVADAQQLADNVEGAPVPQSLPQVVDWLRARRADGTLYVLALRDGAGLNRQTASMSFLPPSVLPLFGASPGATVQQQGLAWEERVSRPGTVQGAARQTIDVLAY